MAAEAEEAAEKEEKDEDDVFDTGAQEPVENIARINAAKNAVIFFCSILFLKKRRPIRPTRFAEVYN